MTLTLAEVEQHRTAVTGVVALMERDLRGVWQTLDWSNPPAVQALMEALLPELGGAYVDQAAALAADFYAETRDAATVTGRARPVLAEPPPKPRFDALAGWGAAPLYSSTPLQALALQRLVGGMTRVVRDGDRQTILRSVEADRGETTWARSAAAGACAFCALLATRGGTYRSKESASRVGSARRAIRSQGTAYHDDCRCMVVPVHAGQDLERPAYQAVWDDAYAAAARDTSGRTSDVLAHMRAALGVR